MLDTDTKRRIDTARDILVGKVPDPKSQVEQITFALIYKFMDDIDAGGYVNRCVNDIRRRPSQPLIQWRFHPHTVHRGRRLRSTQGPSDA